MSKFWKPFIFIIGLLSIGIIILNLCLQNSWIPEGYSHWHIRKITYQKPDIIKDKGTAYKVRVSKNTPWFFQIEGDARHHNRRSKTEFFEDGKAIGTAHTSHSAIYTEGKGAYCHWRNDILFSSSDNSDPRFNAHQYEAIVHCTIQDWIVILAYLGLAMFLLSLRNKMASFGQIIKDEREVIKFINITLWIFLIALFVSLLQRGHVWSWDTESYLYASDIRSMLYVLIMKLNRFINGDNYNYLVLFQLLLGFGAVLFFSNKFKNFFNLNILQTALITLIVLLPYYYDVNVGNTMMSEGICYPLFLIATSYLLEGIVHKNNRALICFIGFMLLLVITRRQFLFLYGVFGSILLLFFILKKREYNTRLLSIVFIASIIGTNLLERSYHYLTFGVFSTVPFTGIQLVVAPMFVSNAEDVNSLKDKTQKEVFLKVREKMVEKKICFECLNTAKVFSQSAYQSFNNNYNEIKWQTYVPIVSPYLKNEKDPKKDSFDRDKFSIKLALDLISCNFGRYVKLYFANIFFSLDNNITSYFISAHVKGFNFRIFYTIYLLPLLFISLRFMRSRFSVISLTSFLLTISNYSSVALVEPVLYRYAIYTDTIQLCVFVIAIILGFRYCLKKYHNIHIIKRILQHPLYRYFNKDENQILLSSQ